MREVFAICLLVLGDPMFIAYWSQVEQNAWPSEIAANEVEVFEDGEDEALSAARAIWRDQKIPVGLSMSIAAYESGWFTSDAFLKKKNAHGMKQPNGDYRSFSSVRHGFDRFAMNMKGDRFSPAFDSTRTMQGLIRAIGDAGWCDPAVKEKWAKDICLIYLKNKEKW